MLIYQLVILALLLVFTAIALRNVRTFARIRRDELPKLMPMVSVLVPARNEEKVILHCIASLLHQTYPNYEVIVLDDDSEDDTPEILARLQERRPDLNVLRGLPLPEGWIGKNWACHQLALVARGELLIFTDADTVHRPESIAAIVAFAERTALPFFSGVPRLRLETFWERVIIPMTQFLYVAYLPNRWITTRRDPKLSAANGQLLCVTRRAYELIGGHEAIKGEIVEDVKLGQRAKERGLRIALATATETVECRMYTSLGEIVAGFSKNLFPGLGYSLPLLALFVIGSLLLYVLPVGFLVHALTMGHFSAKLFWLPAGHLLAAGTIRGAVAYRFRMGWEQIVLQPLSALMAAAIALNSARLAFSKRGATWRGRSYGARMRGKAHGDRNET